MPTSSDGGSEDDAGSIARDVESAIDGALRGVQAAGEDIAGVGLSTYAGNVLGVDGTGRAVTPVYTYADARSAPDVAALRKAFDSDERYDRTGAPIHTAYQAPRLAWVKRERPALLRKTRRWIDLGSYLYGRWLAAGEVPTSYSMASWSGMLDRRRLEWDLPTVAAIGIDPRTLPPLADYSDGVQKLAPAYRKRWPALAGATFFLAVGDGAAANVGIGAVGRAACALTAGTTGALRVVVEGTPPPVPRGLWAYRLDARHSLMGGAITDAGSLFSWLTRNLRVPGRKALEQAIAEMPPASHGIDVMPFLRGERSPGWATNATAAWVGVRATTTPAALVRASLEAIAFRFVLIWEKLREVVDAQEIMVGGRAIRSSPAWMQILADCLQMPLIEATEKGTSTRGIALMTLRALGVIASYDSIRVAQLERYTPNRSAGRVYQRALARHKALYDTLIAVQN